MAKAYNEREINYLGGPHFFAEERNHRNLVECIAGAFIRPRLIFSGCETVGDFYAWQEKGNHLEVRYWDEMPTDMERETTPWTPYEVATYKRVDGKEQFEIVHMTEDEFAQLKRKYPIYETPIEDTYKYTFREMYKCDHPKMDILRSRM